MDGEVKEQVMVVLILVYWIGKGGNSMEVSTLVKIKMGQSTVALERERT